MGQKDNSSPSSYLSTLIKKRCEIYSQVAEHLLEMEEVIEEEKDESLFSTFEKIRRIVRTSLPFLTEQIFFELEQLEALILPHKKKSTPLPFPEIKTRLSVFHVQFSRALKSTESQNMEEILSLPKEVRQEIGESEKRYQSLKEESGKKEEGEKVAKAAEESALKKDWKSAIKSYLKAIELYPRAVHYNDLGVVYASQGALEKAKEAYEQAIQWNEKKPEDRTSQWTLTFFNLAKICQRMGDHHLEKDQLDEAKGFYQQGCKYLDEYLQHSPQGDKVAHAKTFQQQMTNEIDLLEKTLKNLEDLENLRKKNTK